MRRVSDEEEFIVTCKKKNEKKASFYHTTNDYAYIRGRGTHMYIQSA